MNKSNLILISNKTRVRSSLRWATFGSMLAMIYLAGVSSPAFTDFIRSLGGEEIHFAWLGAIPLIMFSLQFFGAFLSNKIHFRKRKCIPIFFISRLLYLVIPVLPLLFPNISQALYLTVILLIVGVSSALSNLGSPIYFSWMADLIPHRIFSRYWGRRHAWEQLTLSSAYVCIAAITFLTDIPIEKFCPYLIGIGILAGILECLIWVKMVLEPENIIPQHDTIFEALFEPYRHHQYRPFIFFTCYRSAVMMSTAVFIPYYLLEIRSLDLWQTITVWWISGLGAAISASAWGRVIDKHGHRPILLLTTCFKSLTMLAYILPSSQWLFPFLIVYCFFDGIINAGFFISTNGYMIRMAPQRNRSMFIATITALAGLCGGVGAIIAGKILSVFSNLSFSFIGREWYNLDLLFFIGALLRFSVLSFARKVQEISSTPVITLIGVLRGVWPLPLFRYPIGLYKWVRKSHEKYDKDGLGEN